MMAQARLRRQPDRVDIFRVSTHAVKRMKFTAIFLLLLQTLALAHSGHEHAEPVTMAGEAVLLGTDCADPVGQAPCAPSCSCVCCHPPMVVQTSDTLVVLSGSRGRWNLGPQPTALEHRNIFRPPRNLA